MLSSLVSSVPGVIALCAALSSASRPGSPGQVHGFQRLVEERQTAFTPAVGVQTGGVQPRLEIRQLYNTQPLQWDLYLLALAQFQSVNESALLSYFQIAGIHGVPNVPWDGVPANPLSTGAVGYCTHSSVLFPAWHRPYLALFEQELFGFVAAVATSFPAGTVRDAYVAAARTFRMPYWDWAAAPPAGQPTMPLLLTAQYATVTTPSGRRSIRNPLFRFDFHPLNKSAMLYFPWTEWQVTKRWPTSNGTTPRGSSQNNLAVAAIENTRISRRDTLYQLFTLCTAYLEFSNDAASSSTAGCSTSLEAIHNQIHSLVGGSNNGDMTWLWWSAFDPIFFLHHTNVDRLFAMWQVLYPNSYGASQVATGPTFTIAPGSTQGPDSPLTPFHATASGGFWTTNSVRNISIFGYTYPEIADSRSRSDMMAFVNTLYGPNATSEAGSTRAAKRAAADVALPLLINPATGRHIDYIANVACQRFALNGTFVIYLFMGNPSQESASTFPFDGNLLGTMSVFAAPNMTMNENVITSTVPLLTGLTRQISGGLLQSMDQIFVIPFLAAALQWRVADANNNIIPNDQCPGLEVSVVTAEFVPAVSNSSFPIYSEWAKLPDVTTGKAGGLGFGCEGVAA